MVVLLCILPCPNWLTPVVDVTLNGLLQPSLLPPRLRSACTVLRLPPHAHIFYYLLTTLHFLHVLQLQFARAVPCTPTCSVSLIVDCLYTHRVRLLRLRLCDSPRPCWFARACTFIALITGCSCWFVCSSPFTHTTPPCCGSPRYYVRIHLILVYAFTYVGCSAVISALPYCTVISRVLYVCRLLFLVRSTPLLIPGQWMDITCYWFGFILLLIVLLPLDDLFVLPLYCIGSRHYPTPLVFSAARTPHLIPTLLLLFMHTPPPPHTHPTPTTPTYPHHQPPTQGQVT